MSRYVMGQLYVGNSPVGDEIKIELGTVGAHITSNFYEVGDSFFNFNSILWNYDPQEASIHISPRYINGEAFAGTVVDVWIYEKVTEGSRILCGAYKIEDGSEVDVGQIASPYSIVQTSNVGFGYAEGNLTTGDYDYACVYLTDRDNIPVYAASSYQDINDFLSTFMGNATSGPGGAGGPTTSPGHTGGQGNQDNSSDPIQTPEFGSDPEGPNFIRGAGSTHLIAIYNPSLAQLQSFSDWIWSAGLEDTFIKAVNNPIDNVVAFNLFPFDIPNSGPATIKFGGIINEKIEMNYVESQFITVDMGSITVEPYWENVLDYAPYTKISIFLPYIGFRELDPDEVMGGSLHLSYNVDLLAGVCVANIEVTNVVDGTNLNALLYTYEGQIASQIPLTSSNRGELVLAMAMTAVGMGTSAAVGVAGVAGTAITAAKAPPVVHQSSLVGASGKPLTYETPPPKVSEAIGPSVDSAINGVSSSASMTAASVIGSKAQVSRSGGFSTNAGMLTVQTPYLVISRPIQSLPDEYNKYAGYPANFTDKLGNQTGLTVVESARLSGFNATESEISEIYDLLVKGVIL